MPPNTADDQTRIVLEAKAWVLRQKGWSQARIASEIDVDQGTVSRWLGRIERREHKRLSKLVQAHKARQNALLEQVVDESFQSWEKSKKPSARITTKKTPMGTVETSEICHREGEPAYLDRVLAALDRQRLLWGLNEPVKRSKDDQGGLTISALAQRLEANGAAYDAGTEPESEPEPEQATDDQVEGDPS